MKKNYFLGFIAFAALTMAGCSNDVNELIPQEEAIEFSSYIGRDAQTRGSVVGVSTLQSKGFGVMAYLNQTNYATANFMDNVKVSGANWDYAPIKYWPTDKVNNFIDFIAYGPYSDNIAANGANDATNDDDNISLNNTTLTLTVPDIVANQTDLVVATPLENKNSGSVSLTFNHMLSRIAFYAKSAASYSNTTIVINSISLTGNFYATGTVGMSADAPAISGSGSTSEITYTPALNSSNTTLTTDFEMQNASTDYLMVIPNSTKADYTLNVTYTVTTLGSASVENQITKTISNQAFAAGKAYAINLDIALNAIGFSVTVSPWKDAEDDGEGEDDFKEIVVTPAS